MRENTACTTKESRGPPWLRRPSHLYCCSARKRSISSTNIVTLKKWIREERSGVDKTLSNFHVSAEFSSFVPSVRVTYESLHIDHQGVQYIAYIYIYIFYYYLDPNCAERFVCGKISKIFYFLSFIIPYSRFRYLFISTPIGILPFLIFLNSSVVFPSFV